MFDQLGKTICIAIAAGFILAGPASNASTAKGGSLGVRTNDGRKHFILTADATWQLNVKERFDASALAFHKGKLLTINDRDAGFYEINLGTNGAAEVKRSNLFPRGELAKFAPKRATRYDCEGIAVDPHGNIYVAEESQRLVFKSSPDGKKIEALAIDWTPVKKFFGPDLNASFEGIAIAGDRLYLANERSSPRIITVDLNSKKVLESFFVDSDAFAFGGPHYTDLAFFAGRLFILNRNHRCIFEVDPETRRVLAEHSFGQMEVAEDVAYQSDYPTGAMEGLAVEEDYFWLITDNNGKVRFKHPQDTRPTLFRCKRAKE
jgi:uncharacterized protein YjiK